MKNSFPFLLAAAFMAACKPIPAPETAVASGIVAKNCAETKKVLSVGGNSTEFRNGMTLISRRSEGNTFQYMLLDEAENCVFSFEAGKRVLPQFSEDSVSGQKKRDDSKTNPTLTDLKSNVLLSKGTVELYSREIASKIVRQCASDHIQVQSFRASSFTLFSYFPKPQSYFQDFWLREARSTPARVEFANCRRFERKNLLNLRFQGIGSLVENGSILELIIFDKKVLYWGKYIEYSRN